MANETAISNRFRKRQTRYLKKKTRTQRCKGERIVYEMNEVNSICHQCITTIDIEITCSIEEEYTVPIERRIHAKLNMKGV